MLISTFLCTKKQPILELLNKIKTIVELTLVEHTTCFNQDYSDLLIITTNLLIKLKQNLTIQKLELKEIPNLNKFRVDKNISDLILVSFCGLAKHNFGSIVCWSF